MSKKFKDLKILVIGTGWFGCHIARKLAKNNVSIEMIEKNNSIFSSQSGFNSNRLERVIVFWLVLSLFKILVSII